jgi:hypothetical protein
MSSSTAEKVFDDLETYEDRVTFSLERIRQIGVEKWKTEIAEAFKLEALILKAERKRYAEERSRMQAVQEAIHNENFIKEILDKHQQFEADQQVEKVWKK